MLNQLRRRLGQPAPPASGITPVGFFELAFGRSPTPDEQQLLDRLVSGIHSLSDARAILRAFDQQSHPTAISIGCGEDDLVEFDAGDFRLWLDRRDVSVSAVILDRREWEPHIGRVLREHLRPGHTFVDVGANIGYHTFLASTLVGSTGRVVAFEPSAENCRLLWLSRHANKAEHVELFSLALDTTPGLRHLVSHLGSNGGLVADAADDVRSGRGAMVQSFRLDDVVEGDVDLLKVDVEGAELRVLAGATSLLARERPTIVMEFSVEMTERISGPDALADLGRLVAGGYELSTLSKDGGDPVGYASLDDLLHSWPDPLHIEDLLLRPRV